VYHSQIRSPVDCKSDRRGFGSLLWLVISLQLKKRKNAVASGEADDREFETWMLMQRDVIDALMESS